MGKNVKSKEIMSNWSTGTKMTKCKKGEKVKNGQNGQI